MLYEYACQIHFCDNGPHEYISKIIFFLPRHGGGKIRKQKAWLALRKEQDRIGNGLNWD
jgi:hypothetical protein